MSVIGRVESLWRYPVKSLRGEELQEAYIGFAGVYGDRLYAFHSSAAPKEFPYLTGREREEMLLYRPAFLNPDQMTKPTNIAEAEVLSPGVTPVYGDSTTMVHVETPRGEVLTIDDPRLISMLREGLREGLELKLLHSDRAMTDCHPISLFSMQTVQQLGEELGIDVDKRRFRANIYIDLENGEGFGEDTFVGHTLRIGTKVVIAVVDRDTRCKMITLDPDTAQANPEVMKRVAREHDGKAGVYATVLVEGSIRPGNQITLLN